MRNIGRKLLILTKVNIIWWVEEIQIISGEEVIRDALKDLDEAKTITNETWEKLPISEAVRDNRLAIIEISKVYTYSILVDAFGAIPYSESLDEKILQPKYDDGADVYSALITSLNDAIAMIDDGEDGFSADQDPVYEGDAALGKNLVIR